MSSSPKLTALVAGATGLVGSELVRQLLSDDRYSKVSVLTRRPIEPQHIKLHIIQTELDDILEHVDEIEGDHLFCCLGTTIRKAGSKEAFKKVDHDSVLRIARLGVQKGFQLFSVVSSQAARMDSPFFYLQVKAEMESELQKIPFQRIHIFRPTLLLGKRPEFRLGERIAALCMKLLGPLFTVLGLRAFTPVEASRVATAMLEKAQDETMGKFIFERPSL